MSHVLRLVGGAQMQNLQHSVKSSLDCLEVEQEASLRFADVFPRRHEVTLRLIISGIVSERDKALDLR